MTIILAILAAILGGVIGAVVGFFAVILIGTLAGADTQQGALAMGAATGGLPLGAVIGAALGAFLVIRHRISTAPVVEKTVETATEGAGAGAGFGGQALIAVLLVAVGIGAFWTWFNWTGDPPVYREANRPTLLVEIKLPADDPDITYAVSRRTDLRSGQVYHGSDSDMLKRVEGDHAILSTRHTMAYKTEDRSIELWLGQQRLLIFTLDLPKKPIEQAGFSEWRPVDHVRPNFYGEDVVPPEGGHDFHIRTRVVMAGG